MAGISNDGANIAIDAITATFWLALYTVNPNFQTGVGGTEAVGGGYAREACAMSAAAARASSNTAVENFVMGVNLAAGTYTGWGVYSLVAGGVFLGGATMAGGDRIIAVAGDTIRFAIGAIDLTIPNA